MKKKLLTILLTLVMVLAMIPMTTGIASAATPHYLTLTAVEDDASFTFRYYSGSAEYSTDGGNTWTPTNKETPYNLNIPTAGSSIMFRGTNVKTSYSNHFTITGNKIAASGDVTSLVNGVGGNATLIDYQFYYMFRDCTKLTTAPSLPSTTLATGCYASMFTGCTSLETAPILPATSLASMCYYHMFYNCSSLVVSNTGEGTPQLVVTTGPMYQMYEDMFYGINAGTLSVVAGASYYWAHPEKAIEYPETWEPYYETLALKIAAQAEIEVAKMLEEAKVVVKEEPVVEVIEIAEVKSEETVAPNGKNSVKVTWTDEKCEGYDIYRAANDGEYKFMFNTTNDYYYNTLIRAGQKYSYKVKGYNTVNGEKVYTDFSTETTCVVK